MTMYDKKQKWFVGLVDYGIAIPEADAAEATEALVADVSRIMTAVKIT